MGFFKKSFKAPTDNDLPPVLQEKKEEKFVKGRRTSLGFFDLAKDSNNNNKVNDPTDDSTEYEEELVDELYESYYIFFPERNFAIRFDEYDKMR
jgi:hypothetical protein